ncbi:MAG: hypothetical protein KF819_04065 [Labilithrix sp.]|nr:hypothetical protein [Labilithrix sp.]
MAAPLRPCPSCRRHVRRTERACPFCAHAVAEAFAREPAVAWPTDAAMSRAAVLLATAAAVASCGKETATTATTATSATTATKDAEPEVSLAAPIYGQAPPPKAPPPPPEDAGAPKTPPQKR